MNESNSVEIAVTRAVPEDHATLADLHGLCFDPPWDVESMAGLLSTPGIPGSIARLEDRAAGFALCRRALYDAAGFTVVGRRADHYRRAGAAPSAAPVLRRDIRPCEGA